MSAESESMCFKEEAVKGVDVIGSSLVAAGIGSRVGASNACSLDDIAVTRETSLDDAKAPISPIYPGSSHGAVADSIKEEVKSIDNVGQFPRLGSDGPQQSIGGAGHPEECIPCAFYCFAARGCKNGAECSFCHQWHESKLQQRRLDWKVSQREKRAARKKGNLQALESEAMSSTQAPSSDYASGVDTDGMSDMCAEKQATKAKMSSMAANCKPSPMSLVADAAASPNAGRQIPGGGLANAGLGAARSKLAPQRASAERAPRLGSTGQPGAPPGLSFAGYPASGGKHPSATGAQAPASAPGVNSRALLGQPARSQPQKIQIEGFRGPRSAASPVFEGSRHLQDGAGAASSADLAPTERGLGSSLAQATPGTQDANFFSYSPDRAVVGVGSLIEMWPPIELLQSRAAFAVSPDLPAGVHLDPCTGVILGRPQAAMDVQTHFVTACKPGQRSAPELSLSMVSIKVVDDRAPGHQSISISQPEPGVTVVTLRDQEVAKPVQSTSSGSTSALQGKVLSSDAVTATGTHWAGSRPWDAIHGEFDKPSTSASSPEARWPNKAAYDPLQDTASSPWSYYGVPMGSRGG